MDVVAYQRQVRNKALLGATAAQSTHPFSSCLSAQPPFPVVAGLTGRYIPPSGGVGYSGTGLSVAHKEGIGVLNLTKLLVPRGGDL